MFRIAARGLRNVARRLANKPGPVKYPLDFDQAAIELHRFVAPFTLTSKERIFTLKQSAEYIVRHKIPGDIVECGVWKGGSMMAVARVLLESGDGQRKLHLFDTFEGMSEPTAADRSVFGESAADLMGKEQHIKETSHVWAYGSMDEVKQNLRMTGYDERNIAFVRGKVEDTIPTHAPERIALLRLDTDWYESTYHELTHLYPRLSVGGVLIIDDYGHWAGARKAVDQYFEENRLKLLLQRIDYTGRMCVKLEP